MLQKMLELMRVYMKNKMMDILESYSAMITSREDLFELKKFFKKYYG